MNGGECIDVEEEFFNDCTYKSLESTIKSNLGDMIKNANTYTINDNDRDALSNAE